MPIRVFNDFSKINTFEDFKRFISAWAKQVHSEINNVITTNISNNQTSISTIDSSITTINSTLSTGLASYNGANVIVSGSNAANNLSIIRGTVDAAGLILLGEGFSVLAVVNVYTITFTTAFFEAPVVVATTLGIGSHVATVNIATATTTVIIKTYDSAGANQVNPFSFIAIGQRTPV